MSSGPQLNINQILPATYDKFRYFLTSSIAQFIENRPIYLLAMQDIDRVACHVLESLKIDHHQLESRSKSDSPHAAMICLLTDEYFRHRGWKVIETNNNPTPRQPDEDSIYDPYFQSCKSSEMKRRDDEGFADREIAAFDRLYTADSTALKEQIIEDIKMVLPKMHNNQAAIIAEEVGPYLKSIFPVRSSYLTEVRIIKQALHTLLICHRNEEGTKSETPEGYFQWLMQEKDPKKFNELCAKSAGDSFVKKEIEAFRFLIKDGNEFLEKQLKQSLKLPDYSTETSKRQTSKITISDQPAERIYYMGEDEIPSSQPPLWSQFWHEQGLTVQTLKAKFPGFSFPCSQENSPLETKLAIRTALSALLEERTGLNDQSFKETVETLATHCWEYAIGTYAVEGIEPYNINNLDHLSDYIAALENADPEAIMKAVNENNKKAAETWWQAQALQELNEIGLNALASDEPSLITIGVNDHVAVVIKATCKTRNDNSLQINYSPSALLVKGQTYIDDAIGISRYRTYDALEIQEALNHQKFKDQWTKILEISNQLEQSEYFGSIEIEKELFDIKNPDEFFEKLFEKVDQVTKHPFKTTYKIEIDHQEMIINSLPDDSWSDDSWSDEGTCKYTCTISLNTRGHSYTLVIIGQYEKMAGTLLGLEDRMSCFYKNAEGIPSPTKEFKREKLAGEVNCMLLEIDRKISKVGREGVYAAALKEAQVNPSEAVGLLTLLYDMLNATDSEFDKLAKKLNTRTLNPQLLSECLGSLENEERNGLVMRIVKWLKDQDNAVLCLAPVNMKSPGIKKEKEKISTPVLKKSHEQTEKRDSHAQQHDDMGPKIATRNDKPITGGESFTAQLAHARKRRKDEHIRIVQQITGTGSTASNPISDSRAPLNLIALWEDSSSEDSADGSEGSSLNGRSGTSHFEPPHLGKERFELLPKDEILWEGADVPALGNDNMQGNEEDRELYRALQLSRELAEKEQIARALKISQEEAATSPSTQKGEEDTHSKRCEHERLVIAREEAASLTDADFSERFTDALNKAKEKIDKDSCKRLVKEFIDLALEKKLTTTSYLPYVVVPMMDSLKSKAKFVKYFKRALNELLSSDFNRYGNYELILSMFEHINNYLDNILATELDEHNIDDSSNDDSLSSSSDDGLFSLSSDDDSDVNDS